MELCGFYVFVRVFGTVSWAKQTREAQSKWVREVLDVKVASELSSEDTYPCPALRLEGCIEGSELCLQGIDGLNV